VILQEIQLHSDTGRSETRGIMKINERVVDNVTILDITGRIISDDGGHDLLRDKIINLVGRGHNKLVLNLGAVPYIDESGLGTLAGSYTVINKSQGGKLRLLNPNKQIIEALTRTRLSTLLDSYSTEQDAIRSFKDSAQAGG
jgi:anti-sigma B factor antagonist